MQCLLWHVLKLINNAYVLINQNIITCRSNKNYMLIIETNSIFWNVLTFICWFSVELSTNSLDTLFAFTSSSLETLKVVLHIFLMMNITAMSFSSIISDFGYRKCDSFPIYFECYLLSFQIQSTCIFCLVGNCIFCPGHSTLNQKYSATMVSATHFFLLGSMGSAEKPKNLGRPGRISAAMYLV